MRSFREWFSQQFSDPQLSFLAIILVTGTLVLLFLGEILAPALASIVVAYLLEGLVGKLMKVHIPRLAAVVIVFCSFLVFLLFLLLGLFPLIWEQVGQLFQQLPTMISWVQKELVRLPDRYPEFISEEQILQILNVLRSELTSLGQRILSYSLASVRTLYGIVIYLFLVPFLVFFFLKDKVQILTWLEVFLPNDRQLAMEVWLEVDQQIGNYIRGKFWEIFIVWSITYLTFTILGLSYAMLLSFFVGVSVLIPYVGATAMIFPVALVSYFQWGWSSQFAAALAAYLVIQTLDGNVLAPLLFSEVVNLHPVATIVAMLIFGGVWGFWGLFFAIPLATLVKGVLNAWIRRRNLGKPGRAPAVPEEHPSRTTVDQVE